MPKRTTIKERYISENKLNQNRKKVVYTMTNIGCVFIKI